MDYISSGVVDWNQREYRRAMADLNNKTLKVPASAKRLDISTGKMVPLSLQEYRDQRARDAARYSRNIALLQEKKA